MHIQAEYNVYFTENELNANFALINGFAEHQRIINVHAWRTNTWIIIIAWN